MWCKVKGWRLWGGVAREEEEGEGRLLVGWVRYIPVACFARAGGVVCGAPILARWFVHSRLVWGRKLKTGTRALLRFYTYIHMRIFFLWLAFVTSDAQACNAQLDFAFFI